MKIFKRRSIAKSGLAAGQITTLSQFGSRLSIAKLHIKKLIDCFVNDNEVQHIFYVVDTANTVLTDYLLALGSSPKISIYTREDNTVTDFDSLKQTAPFGADANYDFLISLPEVGKFFLMLHDDTVLLNPEVNEMLRYYSRYYDFFGYIDSRKGIANYRNLLIDGWELLSLRIGTWFIFGKTKMYLDSNYKMGMYRTLDFAGLEKEFRDTSRLKLLTEEIWLNGGMPFNIQARLDNRRILILDYFPKNYAEHLTKITGFFTARNMMEHIDKDNEVEVWRNRFAELNKNKMPPGTLYMDPEFDKKFLLNLAKRLEAENIKDALLNTTTIEKITQ